MWKAKLKSVSKVDAGGYVEALVVILDEEENILYPNCSIICHPEEVVEKMESLLSSLKTRVEEAENLVNIEVTI